MARYHQKQVFHVFPNSNLVVVDWFTSGRYESGEKWNFSFYKSINHILLEDQPLFIDSVRAHLSASPNICLINLVHPHSNHRLCLMPCHITSSNV
jgi:urease accessory protein UreH